MSAQTNDMSFYDLVYEQVKKIPKGKVATYGQIACACGSPKASRAVGYALHYNPDPEHIPCFRVVNRFGGLAEKFAFGGAPAQAELLRQDGVEVESRLVDGALRFFVDLDKYGITRTPPIFKIYIYESNVENPPPSIEILYTSQ